MRKTAITAASATLFLAGSGLAAAAQSPAASTSANRDDGELVITTVHRRMSPEQRQDLSSPTIQELTCDGVAIQPLTSIPLPVRMQFPGITETRTATLTFAVTADGRPVAIRGTPSTLANDDLQYSLAPWQFPAKASSDCRLTVAWNKSSIEQASLDTLLNFYAVTRTTGATRNAVAKRLGGPDANCGEGGPSRRRSLTANPDYQSLPKPRAGSRDWAVVRWDIDAQGVPQEVSIVGSSGNSAMDAEIQRAASESRYFPGEAVKGCVHNFYMGGEPLPAPAGPLTPPERDPVANCPTATSERLQARVNPTYPRDYNDRGIEGMAVLRFDLAPWGETGNLAILESHPTAAFGEAAISALRSTQAEPEFAAAVRCKITVRFKMTSRTNPPS